MNKSKFVVQRQDQVRGNGGCEGKEQLMIGDKQDMALEGLPAELLDLVLQDIDGEHKEGQADQGQEPAAGEELPARFFTGGSICGGIVAGFACISGIAGGRGLWTVSGASVALGIRFFG